MGSTHGEARPFHCPRCGTRWPAAAITCPACPQPLLPPSELEACRAACESLVERWGEDPYLRSATLVSYSLRSRVRGFLESDRQPFVAAMLAHLREWVRRGGAGAYTQLLPYAESTWIAPRSPLLARALRTLRESRGEEELRRVPEET